jgi:hypothetical protein
MENQTIHNGQAMATTHHGQTTPDAPTTENQTIRNGQAMATTRHGQVMATTRHGQTTQ